MIDEEKLEKARIGYWDAVTLLQVWISDGPDSKEEVLAELDDDLKD